MCILLWFQEKLPRKLTDSGLELPLEVRRQRGLDVPNKSCQHVRSTSDGSPCYLITTTLRWPSTSTVRAPSTHCQHRKAHETSGCVQEFTFTTSNDPGRAADTRNVPSTTARSEDDASKVLSKPATTDSTHFGFTAVTKHGLSSDVGGATRLQRPCCWHNLTRYGMQTPDTNCSERGKRSYVLKDPCCAAKR